MNDLQEQVSNLITTHALLERHRERLYPKGMHPRRAHVNQFLTMTPAEQEDIEEAMSNGVLEVLVHAMNIRNASVSEERDDEVFEVANAVGLRGLDAAREARTCFAFYAYESDSEEDELNFTMQAAFWGRVCDRIAVTC